MRDIREVDGPPRDDADDVSLTQRELDVLNRLLSGDGEKQIAVRLDLSKHTVHDYVKAIYKKHKVASRGELLSLYVTRPVPNPKKYPPLRADQRNCCVCQSGTLSECGWVCWLQTGSRGQGFPGLSLRHDHSAHDVVPRQAVSRPCWFSAGS